MSLNPIYQEREEMESFPKKRFQATGSKQQQPNVMKKYWTPCCPSTKFVRKNLRRQKHSACLMRQVRWSSIRLTTFLWTCSTGSGRLIPADTWCNCAFPNVGTKAWSAQPSIFSPICFFLLCSNGLCLEHNQKRVLENINGWMNDNTLKHTR